MVSGEVRKTKRMRALAIERMAVIVSTIPINKSVLERSSWRTTTLLGRAGSGIGGHPFMVPKTRERSCDVFGQDARGVLMGNERLWGLIVAIVVVAVVTVACGAEMTSSHDQVITHESRLASENDDFVSTRCRCQAPRGRTCYWV